MPYELPPSWADANLNPGDIASVWVTPLMHPEHKRYVCALLAATGEQNTGDALLAWLDGYQPMRYASAVLAACQQAEYEQRAWAQLTRAKDTDTSPYVGLTAELALPVLGHLRKDRPEIRAADTAPMAFKPMLGYRERVGSLLVSVHGEQIGQWEIPAAVDHAVAVIRAHHTCPMDDLYRDAMTEVVGLDTEHSLAMVTMLGDVQTDVVGVPFPGSALGSSLPGSTDRPK